jgi:hypothetical protein
MTQPTVTVFWCDPERALHAQLVEDCEKAERQWELEQDLEDLRTLHEREPELFAQRAATDPFWPPPELDPYEETSVELVPLEGRP